MAKRKQPQDGPPCSKCPGAPAMKITNPQRAECSRCGAVKVAISAVTSEPIESLVAKLDAIATRLEKGPNTSGTIDAMLALDELSTIYQVAEAMHGIGVQVTFRADSTDLLYWLTREGGSLPGALSVLASVGINPDKVEQTPGVRR